MPEFQLVTVDLVVIACYVVVILGIGFWVGRKKEDSESYFLAGRGMVWRLVGFSLIAANFSGTQFSALRGRASRRASPSGTTSGWPPSYCSCSPC